MSDNTPSLVGQYRHEPSRMVLHMHQIRNGAGEPILAHMDPIEAEQVVRELNRAWLSGRSSVEGKRYSEEDMFQSFVAGAVMDQSSPVGPAFREWLAGRGLLESLKTDL